MTVTAPIGAVGEGRPVGPVAHTVRSIRSGPARSSQERWPMTRLGPFASPLLLGFDQIERMLDRAGKAASEGYPRTTSSSWASMRCA